MERKNVWGVCYLTGRSFGGWMTFDLAGCLPLSRSLGWEEPGSRRWRLDRGRGQTGETETDAGETDRCRVLTCAVCPLVTFDPEAFVPALGHVGQFGRDLLLDGCSFVNLVTGAEEVGGQLGSHRLGADALSTGGHSGGNVCGVRGREGLRG